MAGKSSDEKVRCSFCNKMQDQVKKMIAGPSGVYICDECVDICADIIEEEYEEDEAAEELKDLQDTRTKFIERMDDKDAQIEKLKPRLDEKDASIGELEKRLEALQSDRWEKLNSDGMVAEIIAKHLKAELFEPEQSEGIESDGRDVHEREQREEA